MKTRKKKNVATLFICFFIMFLAFSTKVYATETPKEEVKVATAVSKISIKIVNEDGSVDFKSNESEKYIVDFKRSNYDVGEKIEVDLTVKANEGFFFEGISKSDITFTGDKKNVTKSSVNSTASKVTLEVKISAVAGDLDSPDDVQWDERNFGYGEWEEVEGATSYKVSINGSSFSVGDNTYVDLRSYLKAGKDNTFKVRAVSSKSGVGNSDWAKSDELYVEKYYNSGSSSSSSGSWNGWDGSLIPNHSYSTRGWIQNSDGTWYYLDYDGSIHRGWLELSDGTYYLDSNGIMLTGWQKISSNWYIFDSNGRMLRSTGISSANGLWTYYLGYDGKMQTKTWQQDSSGRLYYVGSDAVETSKEITFKDNSGSHIRRVDSNGFVVYGWYYDETDWYYYDYGTGYKLSDTIIDGMYWLDKNGKWYK